MTANWGSSQPGCGIGKFSLYYHFTGVLLLFFPLDAAGACAHGRAVDFYAESVNSNSFQARRCANYAQITGRNCPTGQGTAMMGGDASKALTGIFFLETNGNSPFARG